MKEPVTAIIVGAGHRALLYASYALEHPDELRILGVADPDPIRRRHAASIFGFGEGFKTTPRHVPGSCFLYPVGNIQNSAYTIVFA